MLAVTDSAFAITASIEGSYATGGVYHVKLGQQIDISGDCKTSGIETRDGTWWQVGDGEKVYYPRAGTTTAHKFTVAGVEGTTFDVKLICHTASTFYQNDEASRTFLIVDSTPPEVSWGKHTEYARDSMVVEPFVTDAVSGVGEVLLRWTVPGGMSPGIRPAPISATNEAVLFHHEIDTSGMPEGRKEVQIWAEDKNGNHNDWTTLGRFTIDRSPPASSLKSIKQSQGIATLAISVTDNLSGIDQVLIRWETGSGWSSSAGILLHDSGVPGEYAYAINSSGMPSGDKAIQIRTRDKAGNDSGWLAKGSFSPAHAAPTIGWYTSNAVFAKDAMFVRARVTAANGFSVAQVWIWWKGAPSSGFRMQRESDGSYSYVIPTAGLPEDAQQDVMFWASDSSGETRDWMTPAGSHFTVDRTPPALTIVAAPSGSALGQDLHFVLGISDIASGLDPGHPPQICWMQKNANGTWPGCTQPTTLKPDGANYRFTIPVATLQDGELRVAFNAQDKVGNSHLLPDGAWPNGPHFTIDKTPPTIDWQQPLDHAALTGDRIHIAGTVDDKNPAYVTIEWQAEDDTAWQSHTIQTPTGNAFQYDLTGLAQGVNYRLRMQATDKAGNVSDVTPVRNIIGQLATDALFKNPLFAIVADSLVDKDDSGGFSQGDQLIYSLELQTRKFAANGLSLHYALPPGLAMTPGMRPYFGPGSAMVDGTQLNAHWNGDSDAQLLTDGVNLDADSKLVMHIPVTITGAPAASPIDSIILAGAKNARDQLKLEQRLILQDTFPADSALELEFASLQANWKYTPGGVFDYRITVRVKQWALSEVALRYALPQGLETHGPARIEGDGAAAMALNPAWGKNGADILLSSVPGAMLAARHTFIVTVPVRVSTAAALGSTVQSEIEVSASNLRSPVSAMHRILLKDSREPEQQLVLKKTVKETGAAAPGDTLHYTLTFSNVGTDDLHDLVIRDTIQNDYLTLQDAQCGIALPRTLRCCVSSVSSDRGRQCSAGAGQQSGKLEWQLQGTLEAGDSGSVSYDVLINRR